MIRLALRVARVDAELVLADLLELAPGGVEEIDLGVHDGGEELVEYAVYGAPGELPTLPDLRAAVGGALVEVSTSELPDDWSERWKRFHQPVLIEAPLAEVDGGGDAGVDRIAEVDGGSDVGVDRQALGGDSPTAASDGDVRAGGDVHAEGAERSSHARSKTSLFVRPPWEQQSDRPGALEIVIDPAQAFGTGAHATTRLCLELLLELATTDDWRGPALDVGAGSGVLAIAAVKLGYGPVIALDNDRESVRAIVANAAVNGVEVEARRFDLRREALPGFAGDWDGDGVPVASRAPTVSEPREAELGRVVVLANLLRPLLLDLAETMPVPALPSSRVAPRQLDLIASGLLCEQADEVAQAWAKRHGLREQARRRRGEWAALWLTSARLPRVPSP